MSPIRLRTVAGFLLAFAAMAVCLLAGASAAILLNQQPAAQPNSQATPTVAIARTPAASATSSVKNTTVPATNAPTPLAQATSVYNWKGALPPVPAPISRMRNRRPSGSALATTWTAAVIAASQWLVRRPSP